jgi:hypothetical protein
LYHAGSLCAKRYFSVHSSDIEEQRQYISFTSQSRVSNGKGSKFTISVKDLTAIEQNSTWVDKQGKGAKEQELGGNGATISRKFLFRKMEEDS